MNVSPPSKEEIEEVASEYNTKPFYIEKDWYIVQTLKALTRFNNADLQPVFGGGTSLSKGYGLIKRFSEDIDFKIQYKNRPTRTQKSNYKNSIIDYLNALDWATAAIENAANGNNYFEISITYDHKLFPTPPGVRDKIKLEMSVQNIQTPAELKPIKSFITEITQQPADLIIRCVHPIETAADKLSAFLWRFEEQYEETLLRHLHDLCALEDTVKKHINFKNCATQSYHADIINNRNKSDKDITHNIIQIHKSLKENDQYSKDYKVFVNNMAYGKDADRIEFDQALAALMTYHNIMNLDY